MDMFRADIWEIGLIMAGVALFLGIGGYLLILVLRALRKYTSKEKGKEEKR